MASRPYYKASGKSCSSQAMTDARNTIESRALFEGNRHLVHLRIAKANGSIFINLCDDEWRVVEITPNGWRILNSVDSTPIMFRRRRGMLPLPLPERGGTINDLRPFLNYAIEADFRLQVSWLISAYHPMGPYPLLVFQGEQGTGKSTNTRVMRDLIDPSTVPLRSFPRNEDDMAIAASNAHIVAYDNLSGLTAAMSDALCKLSTGGGFGKRMLYENDEEALFNVKRPVIVNGIDDLVSRQDLASRSIVQNLPIISDNERLDEGAFWTMFEVARPKLLGAIFDVVSCALRNIDIVQLVRLPRLADFAKWVTAAEEALGWEHGGFMMAYCANIETAIDQGLESDPIASSLLRFMSSRGRWEGTSSEFLLCLNPLVDEMTRRSKAWPTDRKLIGRIRRIAAALRTKGIYFHDLGHGKRGHMLAIDRISQTPSTSSGLSNAASHQDFSGDDNFSTSIPRSNIVTISSPQKTHQNKENDDNDAIDDKSAILSTGSDLWI